MELVNAIEKILEAADDTYHDHERDADGLVEGCADHKDALRYAKEIEDSIAAARRPLGVLPELLKFSAQVVERWEKGDMAGAVRELSGVLDELAARQLEDGEEGLASLKEELEEDDEAEAE